MQGLGGSWFRYAGNRMWSWQRDFFDFGNVSALYVEMMKDNVLSEGMKKRVARAVSGERVPGYYAIGTAPASLW